MTESAHPHPTKAHPKPRPHARPRAHKPVEGEVLPPRLSPKVARVVQATARVLEGILPAADGGPAPVVTAARVRFAGWIWAVIGLLAGCIAGALALLLLAGVPGIGRIMVGMSAGAVLGASTTVIFVSRYPFLRKGGGIAILLAPILLLAAPFLLLAGGIALLVRFPKRGARGPGG